MAGLLQPRSRKDFEIALICALRVEFDAVEALFDDYYEGDFADGRAPGDRNAYTAGRICNHNVVLAYMPGIGKANSARVAAGFQTSFSEIKLALLVGVCGGVPFGANDEKEILLGDVVISEGLVQFDFGRQYPNGVVRKSAPSDNLGPPNTEIRAFLAKLSSQRNRTRLKEKTSSYLAELCMKDGFYTSAYPGPDNDKLYQPAYRHKHRDLNACTTCANCQNWDDEVCSNAIESSCEELLCEDKHLIPRARTEKTRDIGPGRRILTTKELHEAQNPLIHFGLIASGDVVMKSGVHRDQIASSEKVIAFEMEGAGVWEIFPTIVIKGVCDYADSHKNKKWQKYAAATAAACMKAVLEEWATAKRPLGIMKTLNATQGHWSVPFLQNKRFVGRGDILNNLDTMFFGTGSCQRVAITGLGGVGKTQIALEFAYRVRDKYPTMSIFWVPATTAENFEGAYLGIGRLLEIPGITDDKADIKALVKQHLSQESTGKWLLVVDNADDIDVLFSKGDSSKGSRLIDLLPKNSQGLVLFTTRNRKAAVKMAQNNVIKISEMGEQTANELLENSLIDPKILDDKPATLAFLQQLEYLPLAIIQAVAYINENGIPISEYLSLLDDTEERVIEILSEEFEDEGRYNESKNPVASTWLISFEQIQKHQKQAADYLSFMSCMDSRNIPQSLLPPALSKKEMVDAIGTLEAYSFITKRLADQSFDLHRLVHLATRNWLREEGLLMRWTDKAVSQLAKIFPSDEHVNRPLWAAYLPHARYVLASNAQNENTEDTTLLQYRVGLAVLADGKYSEAEELFVQVIKAEKSILGVEHPGTLTSMGNLALTYQNQGRWTEAEELDVQVLETRKRVLGVEHPDTLNSMGNLALTYWNQGRWVEAEELDVQVLETRKRVLGVEHPDTLNSMSNLALTYWNQGRWTEAEELEVQVLEMQKRVLGVEHPDTLTSMGNLASTYWNQGRWVEAEELEVQVLEMQKRVLGVEHPETLRSMNNLAHTLKSQSRDHEALALMKECVQLRRQILGTHHPHTRNSVDVLNEWQMESKALEPNIDL